MEAACFDRNRNFYVLEHSALAAIANMRRRCKQPKVTSILVSVDRVHFDLGVNKDRRAVPVIKRFQCSELRAYRFKCFEEYERIINDFSSYNVQPRSFGSGKSSKYWIT